MTTDKRYDFSEESGLKPKLLDQLKKEYAKQLADHALCDDQLELVAAAGSPEALPVCPYSVPCTACIWFNGSCTKHLSKGEGGGGCV